MVKEYLLINYIFLNSFKLDDDNDYHLCEVKSGLDNDGPPLNDFDQTLRVNGLTNGAQLIMKTGSVATKNHVRLRILRIINKIYTPSQASM